MTHDLSIRALLLTSYDWLRVAYVCGPQQIAVVRHWCLGAIAQGRVRLPFDALVPALMWAGAIGADHLRNLLELVEGSRAAVPSSREVLLAREGLAMPDSDPGSRAAWPGPAALGASGAFA